MGHAALFPHGICPTHLLSHCRWSLQKGFVPLPKSNHAERQRLNLDVFRWGLLQLICLLPHACWRLPGCSLAPCGHIVVHTRASSLPDLTRQCLP